MCRLKTVKTSFMKKSFLFVLLNSVLFAATSLANDPPGGMTNVKTGVYGVCNGNGNDGYIQLALNNDGTFHFQDRTVANSAEVTGTWKQHGKTIRLEPTIARVSMREKWKISGNGVCLKSRKGMLFYRLCNC